MVRAALAQRTTPLTFVLFAVVLLNSQHSAALDVQKVISFICTADTSTWDMFIASFIVFFWLQQRVRQHSGYFDMHRRLMSVFIAGPNSSTVHESP